MFSYNEQDLICTNCKNKFDESIHLPRMLPDCGHTFCDNCLQQFLHKSDFIECPEDNIVSSRKEVMSFPKNYSLINILRKQRKQSECFSPQQVNELTPGSEKYSSRKNSQHIISTSGSKRGSIIEDELFQNMQLLQRKCKEHKKDIDIVCLDCKEAICSSCALFGAHKKHEVAAEEEVMKNISDRAEHLLLVYEDVEEQSGLIKNNHYKDIIHNYLVQNKAEVQNEVNEQFKNILKQVEEKKTELLEQINGIFNQQEQMFLNVLDLTKQSILNEIDEWKSKAHEKIQNLCEKSASYELSFDLMEDKQRLTPDLLEVGEQIIRQIEANQTIFQEKIKAVTLQQINFDYQTNMLSQLDNIVKIRLNNDNKNPQNIKLQEQLKQSEIQQKKNIRQDFRKRTSYRKAKKCLDKFYNQNKKEKPNYLIKDNEQILEQLELSEMVLDIQNEQKSNGIYNQNQNEISEESSEDSVEDLKEDKNQIKNNKINILNNDLDQVSEEAMMESLLLKQNIEVNNEINNDENILSSQVMCKDFTQNVQNIQQNHQKPNNINHNFSKNNGNVKLCNEDFDENLISQINNKDFLLTSNISFPNISMNDFNLLDEQCNINEISGTFDLKRNILQSLTRDQNLLLEDSAIGQFDQNKDQDLLLSHSHNDQTNNKMTISTKEQAKFLYIMQEIFSNTITEADLSNMDIGDKGLEILCIAIKDNNSLKTVIINKSGVTDEGFIKFIDFIENCNQNIENIYFIDNLLTQRSIDKLKGLKLNPNRKLQNIYLSNNNIEDKIITQCIQDIKNNQNISIHI